MLLYRPNNLRFTPLDDTAQKKTIWITLRILQANEPHIIIKKLQHFRGTE